MRNRLASNAPRNAVWQRSYFLLGLGLGLSGREVLPEPINKPLLIQVGFHG